MFLNLKYNTSFVPIKVATSIVTIFMARYVNGFFNIKSTIGMTDSIDIRY